MSLPNILTLSRIPLMFAIVGLLYGSWQGAATLGFVLFVIAGVTDWLDGSIARKRGVVSNFGILMDALTDKILMIGIKVAFVELNKVNIFLVLLIIGREFLITGMRLVAASKGVVVSAEKAGKQKTVTQILAIGAFLLADMLSRDWAAWFALDLGSLVRFLDQGGLVLFILATVFTLTSGYRYIRKYGHLVFTEN
ncbi:MAG: CDP-diacylglycerol--glycerol-3-phosphate 3-phosphatidyltransferase [Opitutaceae bacterium]|nr:CDP-diacylglycerol--glycerol-3-phosphate 3-phosphatidyltransferase [Opitutaceae bacterium]